MSFLKNITVSICILSLVYSIFMLLTPDRFHRQIRVVISLITAVVIGGIVLGIKDYSGGISGMDIPEVGEGFINRQELVLEELESRLANEITSIFTENGVPTENIFLKTDIDGDNCIFISELEVTVSGRREDYEQKAESLIKSRIGDIEYRIIYTEDADEF